MNTLIRRDDVEQEWKQLSRIIASKEILGRRKTRRSDEECKRAVDRRNEARRKMLQKETRLNSQKYLEERRAAHRICRRKKREATSKRIADMEAEYSNGKLKDFYQGIRKVKNSFRSKICICKGKDGKVITEEKQVVERWREYFQELLNPRH